LPEPADNLAPESPALGLDERRALVSRIVSSRQLAKAPQLRDILLYISERYLAESVAPIKEQEIACIALGRRPPFNPNEDNIVRVQMSHLRKKLDEYFAAEGRDEQLRISIPKGSYLPRFEANGGTAPAEGPAESAVPAAPLPAEPKRHSIAVLTLSISTGVLFVACMYLLLRPASIREGAPPDGYEWVQSDPLWMRLLGDRKPANIVVSDACLVVLQDVLRLDVPLLPYLDGRYPDTYIRQNSDPALRDALAILVSGQYTSIGNVTVGSRMLELSRHFGGSASLRYARHLNVRDFKTGNSILIGSQRSVPWVRMFESRLNFRFMEPDQRHPFFRNVSPLPGEQATYVPAQDGSTRITYADIALTPNIGNSGSVLILNGLAMSGTEGAGELVATEHFSKEITHLLGAQAARNGYFELLLEVREVAGAARNSRIIAHRLIRSGETLP